MLGKDFEGGCSAKWVLLSGPLPQSGPRAFRDIKSFINLKIQNIFHA
jgi:hypothetical protein